jgi:hypothetical protein
LEPSARPRVGYLAARLIAAAWGLMIVGGMVVGAVGPDSWRHALATGGPGCPFRAVTGMDCPFCGMTRATLAMSSGDVTGALAFHPLAPLVLALVLGLTIVVVIGRTDVLLRGKRPWILLGSILGIWIARLVIGWS